MTTAVLLPLLAAAVLQEAVRDCEYWRLADNDNKAPGLIGWWPNRAVTFVDNHDTGQQQYNSEATTGSGLPSAHMAADALTSICCWAPWRWQCACFVGGTPAAPSTPLASLSAATPASCCCCRLVPMLEQYMSDSVVIDCCPVLCVRVCVFPCRDCRQQPAPLALPQRPCGPGLCIHPDTPWHALHRLGPLL